MIDTPETRVFSDAMQVARAHNMGKSESYTFAARAANLSKYGITDKLQLERFVLSGVLGSITHGENGLETSERGKEIAYDHADGSGSDLSAPSGDDPCAGSVDSDSGSCPRQDEG